MDSKSNGHKKLRKAVRWTLLSVYLAVLFVCTGIQIFTPLQYHGVIRAVMREATLNAGDEILLHFEDTKIAEDQQLQEQICEDLNPFQRSENAVYNFYLTGIRHTVLKLQYERIGQYRVSVTNYYVEDLSGERVISNPFAIYIFRVYYNPFLFSWRTKELW